MASIQDMICQYNQTKDTVIYQQLKEAVRSAESLYIAHFSLTKHYYYGREAGECTAYLFTEEAFLAQFRSRMEAEGIAIEAAVNPVSARMILFGDLLRSGITALALDSGQDALTIRLSELMGTPDFSGLPENLRPVMNPSLLAAAYLYCQKQSRGGASREDEAALYRELCKGEYLMGVDASREGSLGLALIQNKQGQKFFPFFTDQPELLRYDPDRKLRGSKTTFADLKKYAAKAGGVVINPAGLRIVLDSELLSEIEAAAAPAEATVTPPQPETAPPEPPKVPARQERSFFKRGIFGLFGKKG